MFARLNKNIATRQPSVLWEWKITPEDKKREKQINDDFERWKRRVKEDKAYATSKESTEDYITLRSRSQILQRKVYRRKPKVHFIYGR